MEKLFIAIGAAAGVLLTVLILQWFFLSRSRTETPRLYTPADLLVSIRIETLMDLLSLFSPFKIFRREPARTHRQLTRYLKIETKRRRRKQYRILTRMSHEQMRRYDRLTEEEITEIARAARVSEADVRELVIEFCLRLDLFLRKIQRRTSTE